jgi:hypothetical protein
VLYGPLAILDLSVVVRIGGDLLPSLEARRWSGALTAAAIVWFVGSIAVAMAGGRK